VSEFYQLNAELIKKARRSIADDFSIEAQEKLKNHRVRTGYAEIVCQIRENIMEAYEKMKTCIEQL
jgi:hypothetical protein